MWHFANAYMTYILEEFTPVLTTVMAFILAVMISIVIGLFIFFVNEVTKSSLGMILVLIASCADLLIENLNWFGYSIRIPLILSWMDLGKVSNGEI